MIPSSRITAVFLVLFAISAFLSAQSKPNIVIILADELQPLLYN